MDAAEFLSLYEEDIKNKGSLSGETLKQAVEIIENFDEYKRTKIELYIMKIFLYMSKYKYQKDKQGKYLIIMIRHNCAKLNIALIESSDALKRKIDIKSCIPDLDTLNKIDISKDEEIQSLTLEKLTDFNFIQSFLEKYAVNDMSRRYLRLE